jgi:hypothetical protein
MQKIDYRYDDLANSIIRQAVADYRGALDGKGVGKGNGYKPPEYVINEVERFFRSSYFHHLTKVNGEYLIDQLKKEHEEKVRKKNARRINSSNP